MNEKSKGPRLFASFVMIVVAGVAFYQWLGLWPMVAIITLVNFNVSRIVEAIKE